MEFNNFEDRGDAFRPLPWRPHHEKPQHRSLADSDIRALIVFGLVMVYSASAMVAFERSGDEAYYLTRQLIALAVGWSSV